MDIVHYQTIPGMKSIEEKSFNLQIIKGEDLNDS